MKFLKRASAQREEKDRQIVERVKEVLHDIQAKELVQQPIKPSVP